jgi:DNA-binding XRE family transcriptional regulator
MTPSKLNKWRRALGYTKVEMAAALECTYYHYMRLENGVCKLTKDKQKLWGKLHDEFKSRQR